jgi:hypothetical protein
VSGPYAQVQCGFVMTSFKVKWAIEGEMSVEAEDKAGAEKVVELALVQLLTDTTKFPPELGPTSIQGAARPADESGS